MRRGYGHETRGSNMKRILVTTAALCLTMSPALAQLPLKPGVPSILTWTPEQQKAWYPAVETLYQTRTIKRGHRVHPLPQAAHQIAPAFEHDGKTWTVDDYMAAYRVSGLLVIKDGKILLERYGLGRKPNDRWTSFSVAKSVTSTLVGAAIQDGKIKSLDAPVTDYIPELEGSAYDGVTIRQMLMMSSGVKWNEDYADPTSDVAQVSREGFAKGEPGINPLVAYLRKLPRAHEPGTKYNYNTGETDLVGILVSNAVGKPIAEYASEKIWKAYGMERDAAWAVDPSGHERAGCCISMTLRDYGRVGQFVLDGGKAGQRQILPVGWTAEATAPQIDTGAGPGTGYGYFWWVHAPGRYDASGIFGQSITTFPKERLIIVQNAAWPRARAKELTAARNAMIEGVRRAAVQQEPQR